jgi:hypothetical protein
MNSTKMGHVSHVVDVFSHDAQALKTGKMVKTLNTKFI